MGFGVAIHGRGEEDELSCFVGTHRLAGCGGECDFDGAFARGDVSDGVADAAAGFVDESDGEADQAEPCEEHEHREHGSGHGPPRGERDQGVGREDDETCGDGDVDLLPSRVRHAGAYRERDGN